MKIRNDFVSNSSSCSFILQDGDLFQYFNITKKDIIDALNHLMGNPVKGTFEVYDMDNAKDKEKALKKYDWLKEWQCNLTICDPDKPDQLVGGSDAKIMISNYQRLCESLKEIYDIEDFYGYNFCLEEGQKPSKWVRTTQKQPDGCYGYRADLEQFVVDTINDARKKCGIMTNLDILKSKCARYLIHFADNEVWSIEGSTEYSKKDIRDYDSEEEKKKAEMSNFETEMYSMERVMEILFKYWVSIGKINIKDEKFISLLGDNNFDYNILVDDILTSNTHEG